MRIASILATLTCGVVALTFAATHSPAQQSDADEQLRARRLADLRQYKAWIDSYHAGDNGAAKQILAWETKRIEAVVAAIDTPDDPFRPWRQERFVTAAMLHTDAAIDRLYEDEARVGFELDLAARLLHRAGPELRAFSRQWYATVARSLRVVALFPLAEKFLEGGRKRLPDDAVLLYESGVLQEHIATFTAYLTGTAMPEGTVARPLPGGPLQSHVARDDVARQNSAEHRRALNNASQWLGDAIRALPSNDLWQLHFGRVRMLRGDGDALKLLEHVAASAAQPETSYLASMFIAAAHARSGRHEQAERHYRAALAKLPSSQSAYVALSETLQKLGRGDESRQVLDDLLRRPADSRTEPWWWYLADAASDLRRQIAALRETVRK